MLRDKIDITKFKKIMLIFNFSSGTHFFVDRVSKVNEVRRLLKEIGGVDNILEITANSFQEILTLAQRVCDEDFEWVIVAGGDGTLRAITEVLVENRKTPYISIFPLGTVNLVARELFLQPDPETWTTKIIRGTVTPVWLGRANDKIFLTVAGIGIDSMVVDNVSSADKKYLSKFAYVVQGTEVVKRELLLQDWQYKFEVMIDNDGLWRNAASVIVAKSRYYAGWFSLTTGASLTNPKLFVCLFKGGDKIDFLRYVALLATNSLAKDKNVEIVEADRVEIRCNTEDFAAELDGDSLLTSPLSISLLPEPIKFIS